MKNGVNSKVGHRWTIIRGQPWLKAAMEWLRTLDVTWEHAHAGALLAHIDGEAARTAEAVARAGEEMREACEMALRASAEEAAHRDDAALAIHMHRAADLVEDVPLTATPLADELRALRERAEKAEARVAELSLTEKAIKDGCFEEE
jgi:hypothetical protein